jgi:predicted extracellular nuclease
VVESDAFGPGAIDRRFDFKPFHEIGANGFFLAGNCSGLPAEYGVTPDAKISSNYFENSSLTVALVETSSLSGGSVTGAEVVLDAVALTDGDPGDVFFFGAPVIGPDGFFFPAGARRLADGVDTDTAADWAISNFFLSSANTPVGGGMDGCQPLSLTVPEIQGSGQFSIYDGEVATTTGIVTLITSNGRDMWIQDPVGDGDPTTSDGIFVDDRDRLSPRPEVGDLVQLTATVQEQQFGTQLPRTRLDSPHNHPFTIISSGNPLPAPVPLADLPDETRTEGIDFWEPLEGMRVEVKNGRVIAPTGRFGEFGMIAQNDAKQGSGYFPATKHLILNNLGGNVVDYNPERIQVDDAAADVPVVRPGDQVDRLVGVVDYTFSMYKLQIDFVEGVEINPLPEIPASRRTAENHDFTVTTFNVENLFDLVDNPDKDDEGSTPEPDELETQLTKLALAIELELALPEIIVVQEIENEAIAQELADRVNAAAGTSYMARSFETSDGRGIEPGFLWDSNRVELVDAYQLSGPDVAAAFGPGSASPGREPIAGLFDVGGEEPLWIVGNHFKSKGGDDPPYGVSFVRITEVQRKLQAQVVRTFVNTIFDADPDAWVIVTGDLNDFQFGEPGEGTDHPVGILEGIAGEVPLTNMINFEQAKERFTFVFDSNSQILDHTLVSPALLDMVVGQDILHFNAAYPSNLGSDATTTLRASDHDPFEVRFKLD